MDVRGFDGGRDVTGGYRVDVSRGERVGRVSSEWFNRPDDERFLSLDDLFAQVKGRAERSRTRTVESAAIRVDASRDNPERLGLVLPGTEAPVSPTHWSFGQLASLVGAPAAYLRQLPAPLAGINLQYGLTNHRAEQIKTLETEDGRTELRAVTGPDYGRIYDHELVSAVRRIAGNGTGDIRNRSLTAALIDSRDHLAARRRTELQPLLPAGPKIAFTGGADCADHAAIWDALDRVRAKHPDMVLLHGGAPRGAERIAAAWADNRGVTQIVFKPDWTRHGKAAPFRRNDQLLEVLPIGLIVFPGSGITDNLADKARAMGIPLFDFRPKPIPA